MSKHSAWPWEHVKDPCVGDVIVDADGEPIIHTSTDYGYSVDIYIGDEDARLIAAAPEMFEFIKAFAHGLDEPATVKAAAAAGQSDDVAMVRRAVCSLIARIEGKE